MQGRLFISHFATTVKYFRFRISVLGPGWDDTRPNLTRVTSYNYSLPSSSSSSSSSYIWQELLTCRLEIPLHNPTLGGLVARGVTSCDGKQGSGPPKLRCEASCRRLHGNEVATAVSQTTPLGHRATPRRMYAFRPHGALLVVTLILTFF
jgi:hypothetical protein